MNKYESYQEYLASEEWKQKRALVLERDKHRCRRCGAKGYGTILHVHHMWYPQNWGEESIDDLITLCDSCHKEVHERLNAIKRQKEEERIEGARQNKEWVNLIKNRDFIYGGSENVNSQKILKSSIAECKEQYGWKHLRLSDVQHDMGLIHRITVRYLYKKGYSYEDIRLRTPLDKQMIKKYIEEGNPRMFDKLKCISKEDADIAISEYVCKFIS